MEKITDPALLKEIQAAPATSVGEKITDPATLTELEGSEPSTTERFLKGAASPATAALEFVPTVAQKAVADLISAPLTKQGEASEATPAQGKIPQKQIEGFDPVEFAGSMVGPGGIAAGAAKGVAKLAPTMPKLMQGAVTGGAASLLSPTGKNVTDPEFGPTKFVQTAEGLGMGFGMSLGGKAVGKGMEAIGGYLMRNHPDNVMSNAVTKVLRVIQRDEKHTGLSAQNTIDLVDAANAGTIPSHIPGISVNAGVKQPMRVADVGSFDRDPGEKFLPSPGVKALAGYTTRKPGPGQTLARSEMILRDKQAGDRFEELLDKHVSSGPSIYETGKVLHRARKAASAPAYAELDNLHGIWSDYLGRLVKNPNVQQGLNHGYRLARDEADALNIPFNPKSWGVDLDIDGNVKLISVPNMRALDMAKRGLDHLVQENRDSITGKLNADGRAAEMLRQSWVAEIDSLDKKGVYKKARESWSGPSASMDAMNRGKTVLGKDPGQVRDEFSSLSAGDQEYYKLGVAGAMREKLGNTGFTGDEAKAVIKSKSARKQLRPLFPTDEQFNTFAESVAREGTMFRTMSDAWGGSPSAERLLSDATSEQTMAGAHAMSAASHATQAAAHGSIIAGFRFVGDMFRMHRDIGLKPSPELIEATAKVLFTAEGPRLLEKGLTGQLPKQLSVLQKGAPYAESFAPYLNAFTGKATAQQPEIESRAEGGPISAGQP